VAVIAVNVYLFTGPVGTTRRMEAGELPRRRRLLSFVAAEYACTLAATATLQLIPLLVLWRLGAINEAYFTLPWLACIAITLLLWNIGAAFVVAVATNPSETGELLRRSARLGGVVVLGAVLVCCLGGPLILRLAGPGYAEHGTSLMRLVGLSAPFTAVTVVYSSFAWIEQRLWRLVAIQSGSGLLLVALSYALLSRLGLVAVGWAYLGTQVAAAILMAPALRSRLGSRSAPVAALSVEGLP
jgi:O-antigen/teichoic acid export membrane protein